MSTAQIEDAFRRNLPAVDFCSLRFVDARSEDVTVRQNVLEPVRRWNDRGAMVTVIDGGGIGYAATSDLSESGVRTAIEHAAAWAQLFHAFAKLGLLAGLRGSREVASVFAKRFDALSAEALVTLLLAGSLGILLFEPYLREATEQDDARWEQTRKELARLALRSSAATGQSSKK